MKKPRTVRNFWLEGFVDSNSGNRNISFGPNTGKESGFRLDIHMRKEGNIITPIQIVGESDGQHLTLRVQLGLDTHILETER